MKGIEDLVAVSRKYGQDSRFVIAGGGNTSYKDAYRNNGLVPPYLKL